MTGHPFDEIAVEAHAKVLMKGEHPNWNWDEATAYHWIYKERSANALSAAFKSARERGMAETGYGYVIDYDGDFYEWKASSSEPSDKTGRFPVTIIRHKGE